MNRDKIYDAEFVSERDMKFYAELCSAQKLWGYIPPKRLDIDAMFGPEYWSAVSDDLRRKWILADRKHYAQWKLRKIQKQRSIDAENERKRYWLLQELIEEEREKLEKLFWDEAPIMRPWEKAKWEQYNWQPFYEKHSKYAELM